MTITEGIGLLLAIVGLAFAFETPRHWFLRAIWLHEKKRVLENPASLQEPTQHSASHAVVPSKSGASNISVKDIVEAVRGNPLMQRDEASRNYTGIPVDWIGYLRSAEVDFRDKSRVRVNLIIDKHAIADYSIWFSIDSMRVPELKVLRRNSKLRVTGTVIGVAPSGLSVDLEPTDVEVLDPIIS